MCGNRGILPVVSVCISATEFKALLNAILSTTRWLFDVGSCCSRYLLSQTQGGFLGLAEVSTALLIDTK